MTKRYAVTVTAWLGGGTVLLVVPNPPAASRDLGEETQREISYDDVTRESLDAAARELVAFYKSFQVKKEKMISNEKLDAAVYHLLARESGQQVGWLYDTHFGFVEPYYHEEISRKDVSASLVRLRRKGLVYNHDPHGTLAYWGVA